MFSNEEMKEFNMVNDRKLKMFNNRKRLFIFIVGTNSQSIDNLKMEKIFRPKYYQGIVATGNVNLIKDYISLRNALLLVDSLKNEKIHREVYLVRDGMKNMESEFMFLMASNINKFKNRFILPP